MHLFKATVIILSVFLFSTAEGRQEESRSHIDILTKQISSTTNTKELARLHCHRARHHANLDNPEAAETDYVKALGYDMAGWIVLDYGNFLYRDGQYEKSYKLAYNLNKKFSGFDKEARALYEKAKAKYDEEYLKANPPTIIMDTVPNYAYKSRVQLINEVKAREASRRSYGNDGSGGISEYCMKVAAAGGTFSYTVAEGCMQMEAEARQKTESRRSIPSSVVNYCREVASAGGDYSHVVFEGCIEMETDAKRRLGR